jgi:hypothetical protein
MKIVVLDKAKFDGVLVSDIKPGDAVGLIGCSSGDGYILVGDDSRAGFVSTVDGTTLFSHGKPLITVLTTEASSFHKVYKFNDMADLFKYFKTKDASKGKRVYVNKPESDSVCVGDASKDKVYACVGSNDTYYLASMYLYGMGTYYAFVSLKHNGCWGHDGPFKTFGEAIDKAVRLSKGVYEFDTIEEMMKWHLSNVG